MREMLRGFVSAVLGTESAGAVVVWWGFGFCCCGEGGGMKG